MTTYTNPPETCGICARKIHEEFYDASVPTAHGQWGNICPACFREHGCRLGTGRGQYYVKNASGDFVKTAG